MTVRLHNIDTVSHICEVDSYKDIFDHGLRSANALLSEFGVPEEERDKLTGSPRAEMTRLGPHPTYGTARIAHNRPLLRPSGQRMLQQCLDLGESTLEQFCRTLNGRIFFWADLDDAEGYHNEVGDAGTYDVIRLSFSNLRRLASQQGHDVEVGPYNSGSIPRSPRPRGNGTWTALADYGPNAPVQEVTILDRLDNIHEAAMQVYRVTPDGRERVWVSGPWQ